MTETWLIRLHPNQDIEEIQDFFDGTKFILKSDQGSWFVDSQQANIESAKDKANELIAQMNGALEMGMPNQFDQLSCDGLFTRGNIHKMFVNETMRLRTKLYITKHLDDGTEIKISLEDPYTRAAIKDGDETIMNMFGLLSGLSNFVELYRFYEFMNEALSASGGVIGSGFASKADISRFTASCQFERHYKYNKISNPMSFDEARSFVKLLAHRHLISIYG